MGRSETIAKLATALAKAQGSIEDAKKDSMNPHFKSAYSDLASVRSAIRTPLSENGLSYVQIARTGEKSAGVETILFHESGEFISGELDMPVAPMTPQAIGSALTYAKRFSLMALIGIAASEDDDDGNAAHDGSKAPRKQPDPAPSVREAAPSDDSAARAKLFDEGNAAAGFGMEALGVFWNRISPAQKKALGGAEQIGRWKTTASGVQTDSTPFDQAAE